MVKLSRKSLFQFSTDAQLYKYSNMGGVLPYGLSGKVLCVLL